MPDFPHRHYKKFTLLTSEAVVRLGQKLTQIQTQTTLARRGPSYIGSGSEARTSTPL